MQLFRIRLAFCTISVNKIFTQNLINMLINSENPLDIEILSEYNINMIFLTKQGRLVNYSRRPFAFIFDFDLG